MPPESEQTTRAVHATAVAIDGRGLLILGRSGAGKSRLAADLLAASSRHRRIQFVGDDRILLRESTRGIEARPHPRIAGFLERRGLGIVAVPHRPSAPLAALVKLGEDERDDDAGVPKNLPTLRLVPRSVEACDHVLSWWDGLGATFPSQTRGKRALQSMPLRKKCNW